MTLRARVRRRLGDLALDVQLEVSSGEVVALLGPNGAGKTTLLGALAGLIALDAGRVELGGRVLEDPETRIRLPPEQRSVGMLFQDHLLFPHLSALDNVAFGLRAQGATRADASRQAAAWLSRLGLASLSGARSRQLSGGQAQRVALARALASGPDLLLLDEPLSALDVEARLAVRRELREHLGTFSGPCVLVTHDPVDAVALADRLVIVEAGRVVQSGRVAEVTRRPRSAWIARLVGLNLYRGSSAHGRVGLDGGGTLVAVAPLDGPVFAAVHPRSVALHRRAPEGSPRNVWQGVVDGLDVSGDRVRVQVAGPQPIVAEITSLALRDLDLARGGDVWVSVKATEVELYRA